MGCSPSPSAAPHPSTALHSEKTDASILAAELPRLGRGWLLDGEISRHFPLTLTIRRFLLDKLSWFLTTRRCERCGALDLPQFL